MVWNLAGSSDETSRRRGTNSMELERFGGIFFSMQLRVAGVEQRYMWKPLVVSFLASSRYGVMWP